jgi:hypothetical protein
MHKRIWSLIYFFQIILHALNDFIYSQPLTTNALLFVVLYKKKVAKSWQRKDPI